LNNFSDLPDKILESIKIGTSYFLRLENKCFKRLIAETALPARRDKSCKSTWRSNQVGSSFIAFTGQNSWQQ
jgi:hypothetical protein